MMIFILTRDYKMSYKIIVVDQENGNHNTWFINMREPELFKKIQEILKTQKQSEIIIIEKRE